MRSFRQDYDREKVILGKEKVSFQERQEKVVTFLRSVLNQYELHKTAKLKHHRLGTLSQENHYFHAFIQAEQITFDSFVLDQRTKEGRITSRWLKLTTEKQQGVTLESLCDFMIKLAHTFLNSYQLSNGNPLEYNNSLFFFFFFLQKKKKSSQYYKCVRIFVYRCILGQPLIQKLIADIMPVRFEELHKLDKIFQRKIIWMKSLKHDQLQIEKDFWYTPCCANLCIKENADDDSSSDAEHEHHVTFMKKERKRKRERELCSQSELQTGDGVPFAEAIDIIGKFEKHTDIYESPDNGLNLILKAIKSVHDTAMKYFESYLIFT
ncbi:hypothetical protein RFI_37679 [Reticulomyxa filosa]|uniref:Uncharacterized protein n=1 Tax=Reticulomyxa filosa TaxID=46433 RepID=X6LCN5_RETFI|nr:hypothetical protein RFI_37679 [Reticulomyxa filosa]|eukprot:ETN99787.1 hypothetical protein RFI_37679 [Reticulomyxa filosa]